MRQLSEILSAIEEDVLALRAVRRDSSADLKDPSAAAPDLETILIDSEVSCPHAPLPCCPSACHAVTHAPLPLLSMLSPTHSPTAASPRLAGGNGGRRTVQKATALQSVNRGPHSRRGQQTGPSHTQESTRTPPGVIRPRTTQSTNYWRGSERSHLVCPLPCLLLSLPCLVLLPRVADVPGCS